MLIRLQIWSFTRSKGVIIFYLTGGCGRNGMKDSVKFLIPPWKQQKNCWSPSLFVRISCDPPLSNHHHQKFVGFTMMSCWHAKVIALASWGSGGAVRSPGQNLREVQGSEPTEAPKIQEFPEVKMAIMAIAHNNVGNCRETLPQTGKRLDVLL